MPKVAESSDPISCPVREGPAEEEEALKKGSLASGDRCDMRISKVTSWYFDGVAKPMDWIAGLLDAPDSEGEAAGRESLNVESSAESDGRRGCELGDVR
jgi:hypothetical protein